MSFLADFAKLVGSYLGPTIPNPGLRLDAPSVFEALPQHDLFAGAVSTQSVDWKSHLPPFRYQGPTYWCTAYAGTNIASTLENKETGKTILFSPPELFYRTNGVVTGNSLVNAANGMSNGLVLESDMPTQVPDAWNQAIWDKFRTKSLATAEQLERGKPYRVKSFANVVPTKAKLREALLHSPLMIAIGIGKGYFSDPAPVPSAYSAYHGLELIGIDDDDCYVVFDSLEDHQGFGGIHRLSPNYEITAALSFIDVPDDWQTAQQNVKESRYGVALNHYGLPRSLSLEKKVADDLAAACKKNTSISAMIGKDFTVCVNAVAYGGYSIQDILNQYTSIRRMNQPIFDLNKPRGVWR